LGGEKDRPKKRGKNIPTFCSRRRRKEKPFIRGRPRQGQKYSSEGARLENQLIAFKRSKYSYTERERKKSHLPKRNGGDTKTAETKVETEKQGKGRARVL